MVGVPKDKIRKCSSAASISNYLKSSLLKTKNCQMQLSNYYLQII